MDFSTARLHFSILLNNQDSNLLFKNNTFDLIDSYPKSL